MESTIYSLTKRCGKSILSENPDYLSDGRGGGLTNPSGIENLILSAQPLRLLTAIVCFASAKYIDFERSHPISGASMKNIRNLFNRISFLTVVVAMAAVSNLFAQYSEATLDGPWFARNKVIDTFAVDNIGYVVFDGKSGDGLPSNCRYRKKYPRYEMTIKSTA